MKSLIIILLTLGLTFPSFSQVKKTQEKEAPMKIEELPGVVIKRAGKDFSIYLPDNNPDKNVRNLEDKFIAYDIGKDYEGSEEYLLILETKKGSLAATYNETGKLIRVVENFKNVKLPNLVIYSIYKTYPGWRIVNDKYLYSQEQGDIIKKQYHIKIKKGKETQKLTVRPNGEIIKEK
jgi:hypothetical protein